MNYRTLLNTNISVSEVGFGLWTVSTGWWGDYDDNEAIRLLKVAHNYGITLFDAADTYGNGRSEELIAKAFHKKDRSEIVISTKIGYDFVNYAGERKGQKEIPQDFSNLAIRNSVDAALKRLKTDYIDILQLHNIKEEQIIDDDVWMTLDSLLQEGKCRSAGIALGPAIGWLYEGASAIIKRNVPVIQHIYNLLEQHPGATLHKIAQNFSTQFLIRVPHSSGLLEGKYTATTEFPPNDHRNHRPRSWLINGIKKIDQLRFLEGQNRTLGQVAIQWLLRDPKTLSILPNIYDEDQIKEFAKTSEVIALSDDEYKKIQFLVENNFHLEEEKKTYKGNMTLPLEYEVTQ